MYNEKSCQRPRTLKFKLLPKNPWLLVSEIFNAPKFCKITVCINVMIKLIQSNLSLRPPDKSDHLKIADTQFQSLEFTDSNVWSAFLKMRPPEKCELRTPKVGPKRQSNLQKATTCVKLSEKALFWLSNFSFAGTPNERSSCLQGPFGKVVANYAPTYTWEPPIANVMARAGACVQLHIETKPGKWDHLKNRTTN